MSFDLFICRHNASPYSHVTFVGICYVVLGSSVNLFYPDEHVSTCICVFINTRYFENRLLESLHSTHRTEELTSAFSLSWFVMKVRRRVSLRSCCRLDTSRAVSSLRSTLASVSTRSAFRRMMSFSRITFLDIASQDSNNNRSL